jgi:two-component system, chemotaxis family, protein-glutamate methylesterase/glutaminase
MGIENMPGNGIVRCEGGRATMFAHDLIVVGTSAGGLEALRGIVGALPEDLPAAILIVMHMSPQGPYLLPEILRKTSRLEIAKAVDGAPIEQGKIYIAPPDLHLLVKADQLALSRGPKENRSRPAIDPLFRTAAAAYGPRLVGVILTGMLDDGTAGLAAVKQQGGVSVVQDPLDALYPSMPESALRYVGGDFVLPVSQIAALLARLAREPIEVPERTPASRLLEVECRFVEMETMSMKDMDIIGSHAGVSCPECHGPMWKIKDGTRERYRCHVGHAYSAQTMAAGQVEAQETHLWQALRLMKERVSLIWELRSHAQNEKREKDAGVYEAKVAQLQKNIALIQTMVEEGDA